MTDHGVVFQVCVVFYSKSTILKPKPRFVKFLLIFKLYYF